jgi:polyisoprenoid-binding protein YceI
MATYTIDSATSTLVVSARSSVHDTDTRWKGITGSVEIDRANLAATTGTIEVDMTTADAGDWLKNRKLKKDINFDEHPRATFVVGGLEEIRDEGDTVRASVRGTLSWRGKSVEVVASGSGTIGDSELRASGSFELDVTTLGVKPPKVLMFKIEDVVGCKIELSARAS